VFHLADPKDDDVDNDGDTVVDEFVTPNGPIRNFNMQQVNGPDMRFATFEEIADDFAKRYPRGGSVRPVS